ncbi:MAG: hypothetical protein E7056_02365 [Lentisphaerae bacterium]|nr:hypothetical protein [Lentisphaerota bacterium]
MWHSVKICSTWISCTNTVSAECSGCRLILILPNGSRSSNSGWKVCGIILPCSAYPAAMSPELVPVWIWRRKEWIL